MGKKEKTQIEKFLKLLIDFCNKQGSRTFSLKNLNAYYDNYNVIELGGKSPDATVRRLLQELRDKEKAIHFLDNSGNYTLGGENLDFLLEEEKQELHTIDLSSEPNREKKEYLQESYFRNTTMVTLAKKQFGLFCLHPKCKNTFLTKRKTPYIEVHHIIPLCEQGIDKLENLSVVCAHHHKMAHFSDAKTKLQIQKVLYQETLARL